MSENTNFKDTISEELSHYSPNIQNVKGSSEKNVIGAWMVSGLVNPNYENPAPTPKELVEIADKHYRDINKFRKIGRQIRGDSKFGQPIDQIFPEEGRTIQIVNKYEKPSEGLEREVDVLYTHKNSEWLAEFTVYDGFEEVWEN